MTSSTAYNLKSMDLSFSSNGLKMLKRKTIFSTTTKNSSLQGKSLITHALLKPSFQFYLILPSKLKAVLKNSMTLLNNCLQKIEDLFWAILKLSESSITASVDLNLLFSKKIRRKRKNKQMFTILWVISHIKDIFMNLMVFNPVSYTHLTLPTTPYV